MTKPKILHIEDEQSIRKLVIQVLEEEFVVEGASTGLDGIKKAQTFQPDLILMDLQLPNMSGYEATTRIRSFDELRDVPIIAVTGNNSAEEREKTLAAGCKGFIPKPIDLFALPDQIREYLSGKTEETTEERRSEYFKKYSEELVKKLQGRVEELTSANEEMQRLNNELRRRDQYLENMVDALWVVDDEDKTRDVNPSLLEMLRYPTEDLMGAPIYKFMDEDSRKKYFDISVNSLQQGKASQTELTFITEDGSQVKALVSSQPVTAEYSEAGGCFHILHDITERKKLEMELRESEKKYRTLVDNSLIGIFRITEEGRFTTVNPRFVEILGFETEKEVYKIENVKSLFKDPAGLEDIFRRLEQHSVVSDAEVVLTRVDGEEIVVLVNVQRVQDEFREGVVYEGLIEDITEKRRLELSLKQVNRELEVKNRINKVILSETRLEKVLEHLISNAIQVLEVDATAIYLYDESDQELRYGYGQGLDPNWLHHFRTLPVNESNFHLLSQSVIREQAVVTKDLDTFLRHDQQNGYWKFSREGTWLSMPISLNEKVLGVLLCVKQDTSTLTEQEFRTIEALTNQMAIGINHVTQIEDLNASKQALEESYAELARMNKFKDEFLANMSHELRTPLNSIIGFSEVLIDGLAGDINEEQEEFINNILGSGQHLLSLINEILDMSKIRSGQMDLNLEEVDCESLIREISQTMSGMIRSKNQEFVREIHSELPPLVIDKKKIKQVLLNLLSNASKFTDEEGEISVEVFPVDQADQSLVQFTVSDTGIGIDQEHQELIFDEFRQVDGSNSREYEGTGLGLPIAKKLVELHNGKIWIESEVGVGTKFHFVLPMEEPQAESAVAEEIIDGS